MGNSKAESKNVSQKMSRSVKNYALQPYLQIKLGLYSVILSVMFAAIITAILYFNLGKLSEIILELTGVPDEVRDLLHQYINPAIYQILATIAVYVVANIAITILFTHRLIGPTIAFRRHVKMISEGKYQHRTVLRKGDSFMELADDLNRLSSQLEKNSK
jgi:HAMP domain-containing protein